MFFLATDFCFARYSSRITRIFGRLGRNKFTRIKYKGESWIMLGASPEKVGTGVVNFNSLREWFFQPRMTRIFGRLGRNKFTRIKYKGESWINTTCFDGLRGIILRSKNSAVLCATLPKKSGQVRFVF